MAAATRVGPQRPDDNHESRYRPQPCRGGAQQYTHLEQISHVVPPRVE
jgi:hypothetical protein